jgi:hypothetical protein
MQVNRPYYFNNIRIRSQPGLQPWVSSCMLVVFILSVADSYHAQGKSSPVVPSYLHRVLWARIWTRDMASPAGNVCGISVCRTCW